MVINRI